MPIFVSRFDNDRGAGFLHAIRGNRANRLEDRSENDRPRGVTRGREAEATRRGENGRRPQNVREQLPPQTQAARQLRDRLTSENNGRADRADREESTQRVPVREEVRPTRRPTQRPAVRATDTPSERRAEGADERPGWLRRQPTNVAVQNALDRFASLRNVRRAEAGGRTEGSATIGEIADDGPLPVPGRERVEQNAPRPATEALRDLARETPNVETLQARGLNRNADATIRLAAVQNQTTPQVASPQTEEPTAEQISQANTTEEIRENLQADSSDIQRGLTADADAQQRQNLRQTARAATQGAEARRESRIDSNDRQAQALRSETRELAQDLRATQRDLRNVENENRRLQTTPDNTASTAANLANRVNILAA